MGGRARVLGRGVGGRAARSGASYARRPADARAGLRRAARSHGPDASDGTATGAAIAAAARSHAPLFRRQHGPPSPGDRSHGRDYGDAPSHGPDDHSHGSRHRPQHDRTSSDTIGTQARAAGRTDRTTATHRRTARDDHSHRPGHQRNTSPHGRSHGPDYGDAQSHGPHSRRSHRPGHPQRHRRTARTAARTGPETGSRTIAQPRNRPLVLIRNPHRPPGVLLARPVPFTVPDGMIGRPDLDSDPGARS